MRVRVAALMLAASFFLAFPSVYASEEPYFTQMGQALTRGIKNMISFPWEIPSTIDRYDQKDSTTLRVFRDAAGFVDGSFRAVTRLGSGIWDVVFSVVPGAQNELSLKPETFF